MLKRMPVGMDGHDVHVGSPLSGVTRLSHCGSDADDGQRCRGQQPDVYAGEGATRGGRDPGAADGHDAAPVEAGVGEVHRSVRRHVAREPWIVERVAAPHATDLELPGEDAELPIVKLVERRDRMVSKHELLDTVWLATPSQT